MQKNVIAVIIAKPDANPSNPSTKLNEFIRSTTQNTVIPIPKNECNSKKTW